MFVLAAASAVLSAFAVFLLRRWAVRRNIVDVPNERSSHARPTARGGGLAIVGVTFLGLGIVVGADACTPMSVWLPFAGGSLLIAVVSWWDDLRSVKAGIRLTVHALAALIALLALGSWEVVA